MNDDFNQTTENELDHNLGVNSVDGRQGPSPGIPGVHPGTRTSSKSGRLEQMNVCGYFCKIYEI